jgi:general secretion pathway protein D
VATGSFGTGVAAGAFNPLGAINTQFQYLDVGVNIDITPRVHANREVTLKLMLDVSSVTGSSNIGGISQPIISQRKVEHEIRLKEGEVNLLGGIFENTDTKSIAGIPGLARLPFLKYLFSDQKVNHSENEIVFVLTPHIVRGQELTEQNLRPVDIGTANQIDLRRVTRPAEMTTGGAAPAKPAPMPQQPAPQQPVPQTGVLPQAAQNEMPPGGQTLGRGSDQPAPGSAGTGTLAATTPSNIVLSMNPAAAQQTPGSTFNLSITATGARDLYAAPMQISYNPKMLELVNVSNGDLLSKDGQPVALAHREDTAAGIIQVNGTRPPGTPGISGDGVLYVLTFRAMVPGSSTVEVTRPSLRNASMGVLPMTPPNATTITVR